ncbi:single stranded DNA-binding protein [Sinomonas atrocyanea]|uniref:single-stranded DNA-binding protein n=1 Tax=Sinomonas atrocyanea TaxID=37927 RepID=UPI00278AC160|nr:single-stranded DNA-binding protein [Sinomonas atrocyanea]MDP9886024.1 single stranded DNA-binding protein [Sinomonas atrocyanea]
MTQYTEEQDQAWIDGRTTRPEPTTPAQPAQSTHPQVHALQHALAQLREARYWPQADPDVQAAVRAAAAVADELTHHVHENNTHGIELREADRAGETVTVTGNLVAAPRLDRTPAGTPVADFTIATAPRTYDRVTGEWKDGETAFIRCTLWREAARHAAASLAKGTRVIATGTLTTGTYQAKDGQTRTSSELDVDELGASLLFNPVTISRRSRHHNHRAQAPVEGTEQC